MSRIVAPAKLTVSLQVTGVRPDGYHELRAEMVALDLADELTFVDGGTGLTIDAAPGTRADDLGGDGDNLITQALSLVGRTAAVHVVKRIPVGGGLGGGSSDAAAVLRWAGRDDVGLALRLGADVPFSLSGGRALVEGVGERVTALPFESRRYLLLIPSFGVSTQRVYQAWDDMQRDGVVPDGARGPAAHAPAGSDGPSTGGALGAAGINELTAAAIRVEPRLAYWRDALAEFAGSEPTLAGSGSTWFVRVEDGETGSGSGPSLQHGSESALLVRARTVPAGWEGE